MDKMSGTDALMATAAAGIRQEFPITEKDCIDDKGYIMCGLCNTRKERDVTISTPEGTKVYKKIPIACECAYKKFVEAQEKIEWQKTEDRRIAGIPDSRYRNYRFENDDSPGSMNSLVLRAYAAKWEKAFESNEGILLNGTMGTGKSFYACCIANAVIDKGYSATVTTISKLRMELDDNAKKSGVLYDIANVSLLVLDDFGTESATDHALAITNLVIDTRSKSGKPLIITTNLTNEQMNDPKCIPPRVADRIYELCPIQLGFTGMSRRRDTAERSSKAIYNLLAE